jgi:Winged helix DNA-binding domain
MNVAFLNLALRRRRAAGQLLCGGGPSTPAGIVEHLLAVQAQDLRAAYLALRARGAGTAADVAAALADRTLVVGWLMRGTLHLVGRDDYPWLLRLTAPSQEAGSRRRLGEEGVDPDTAERALGVVEKALAERGPLIRQQLGEELAAAGVRTEGQALPHLLRLACLRGIAVLGPVVEDGQAFVLARDWLGADPDEPADLLAELAVRYLRGHAPATAADLARWAGIGLRDARAGLRVIADRLVELDGGLVDLAGRAAAGEVPPRLLPAFDPYVLGWQDRGFAVPDAYAKRVFPGGGILRAVATADGRTVGTWTLRAGTPRVEPFAPLDPHVKTALDAEAADVVRFEMSRTR